MSEPYQDPNLAELAAALKALAPAPARLDRDRLLYRAGQVSARRTGWLWPATAAAVVALAAGALTGALALRPGPQTVERIVVVNKAMPAPLPVPPRLPPQAPPEKPQAAPVPPVQSLSAEAVARETFPEGYLRLRDQVLRWGVDALPSRPAGAASGRRPTPTTVHDHLSDWLPATSSPFPRGSL
jgi:hypothetical protein